MSREKVTFACRAPTKCALLTKTGIQLVSLILLCGCGGGFSEDTENALPFSNEIFGHDQPDSTTEQQRPWKPPPSAVGSAM